MTPGDGGNDVEDSGNVYGGGGGGVMVDGKGPDYLSDNPGYGWGGGGGGYSGMGSPGAILIEVEDHDLTPSIQQ